jgi:hypothetical protein
MQTDNLIRCHKINAISAFVEVYAIKAIADILNVGRIIDT